MVEIGGMDGLTTVLDVGYRGVSGSPVHNVRFLSIYVRCWGYFHRQFDKPDKAIHDPFETLCPNEKRPRRTAFHAAVEED